MDSIFAARTYQGTIAMHYHDNRCEIMASDVNNGGNQNIVLTLDPNHIDDLQKWIDEVRGPHVR